MGSQKIQFFTICARNYAAQAAALAESIQRWHSDAIFTVWLLDPGSVPSAMNNLQFRYVRECVDDELYYQMLVRYNVLELSTAVKPAVFMKHFAEDSQRVIYIDPDILLFRPLKEVIDALDSGACGVLTPHMLSPLPHDNKHPDDLDILRSGTFNLGFLALQVSKDSEAFLEWWWKWLQTQCYSDPSTGIFTDQRWVDFADVFWPSFYVLRDATYNVAYWNLHERTLMKRDEQWLINEKPLAFFHFSGFDVHTPTVLSKHQTRIVTKKHSPLREILEHYAHRLQAYKAEEASSLPLPKITFDDEVLFDVVCQRSLKIAEEQKINFTSILASGKGSFRSWLSSVEVGQKFPNYVLGIFLLRPDVEQAMRGATLDTVAHWMRQFGISELKLDPRLIDECLGYAHTTPNLVNYVGYISAELGIGEAARGYLRAMNAVGIESSQIDVSSMALHKAKDMSLVKNTRRGLTSANINVYHVNADQLLPVMDKVGLPRPSKGQYNIGLWAWESLDFPDQWTNRFELVNEIWVGSRFMASGIAKKSSVPVVVVPYVIEIPKIEAHRSLFGLAPDEFIFLFTFDFLSIVERKNPLATIAAFRAAFAPSDPVRLVIKSMNGEHRPEMYRELKQATEGMRVTFMDASISTDRRYQLLQVCDAYISLHRAEGFGLGMAEAMAYGKPVIATGWSGNMDFMTAHNSMPVDFVLRPLARAAGPYAAGTIWAEPSTEDAAQKLRAVWQDEELRDRIARRGSRDIAEQFSPSVVGKLIKERVEVITEQSRASELYYPPHRFKRMRYVLLTDLGSHPVDYIRSVPKAVGTLQRQGMSGIKEQLKLRLHSRTF